jgi:hypothetical protein
VTEDAKTNGRRPAGRSPSYPGVSLRVAVDRAQQLYKAENRYATPVPAAMAVWGYTNPGGGTAGVTLAALKKFGLLIEEKVAEKRVVRLSELALEIILSPEPERAIRQAALLPQLHREMWEKYGNNLPSDQNLRWQLIQRGFTEAGANDFLKVYRDTVAFARLETGVIETPQDTTTESFANPDEAPVVPERQVVNGPYAQVPQLGADRRGGEPGPPQVHGLRMPFRLAGGEVVYLEGEFPITAPAFENLLQILAVMRPGLVREDD